MATEAGPTLEDHEPYRAACEKLRGLLRRRNQFAATAEKVASELAELQGEVATGRRYEFGATDEEIELESRVGELLDLPEPATRIKRLQALRERAADLADGGRALGIAIERQQKIVAERRSEANRAVGRQVASEWNRLADASGTALVSLWTAARAERMFRARLDTNDVTPTGEPDGLGNAAFTRSETLEHLLVIWSRDNRRHLPKRLPDDLQAAIDSL